MICEMRGLIPLHAVFVIIWENDRPFAQPPIMSARVQVASPLQFHTRTYTTVAVVAAAAAPF